ncbi:MAG TPA: rhomboid family intramembrane serine protease [Flavobacterium sp.]|nr:rhomboid family intramembrane serine protease [Flavobacterium sp.]
MLEKNLRFSPSVLAWPLFSVVLVWVVFWAEIRFRLNLGEFGIYPRALEGLRGIFFSPFLHGDISHIYNNSIPLFVLVAALRFFYRNQALKVIGCGILLSGFLTWAIGRESYHIGASGLIYVLASFIFFKGIQTRYYRLVAVSLSVILLYGGMVWYVFPGAGEGISWESHLAGFVTGYIFSATIKTPEYQKQVLYEWEKPGYKPEDDAFMRHFDENGNFQELPKSEEAGEEAYFKSDLAAFYTIVPAPDVTEVEGRDASTREEE